MKKIRMIVGSFVLITSALGPSAKKAVAAPLSVDELPAAESPSNFGFYFGLGYGIGRNLNPEEGPISSAYVSSPELALGVGDPGGTAFTMALSGIAGHNGQTSSDVLVGPRIRLAPEKLAGTFGQISVDIGPKKEVRDGGEHRTVLFGVHGGFSVPVGEYEMSVGAGLRLGEERHDGFVAVPEMRIGFAYTLPWSRFSNSEAQ